MNDVTIIYYTSNREKPEFVKKTKENLLKVCGNLPIISVSQKPIEMPGINIVVGDVGASGFNMFRQVLIACEAAKTKFVVSAEVDCLYPPDYFQFIPPKDNLCYRDTNLYVMGYRRECFWRKVEGATHAQIVGRKYYIETLKALFKGAPKWSVEEKNFPKERHRKVDVFPRAKLYETKNPVVQIKTKDSMRFHTHSERIDIHDIPYWGNGKKFREKYL